MRSFWLPLVVVALFSSRLASAEDGKASLQDLQGTWKCLWFESNGVKQEKSPTDARLVIDDDRWNWANRWKCTIAVDTATSPSVINLEENGRSVEGIFRLEGDRLTFCWRPVGAVKERPTKFTTKEGDGCQVVAFEREKKK